MFRAECEGHVATSAHDSSCFPGSSKGLRTLHRFPSENEILQHRVLFLPVLSGPAPRGDCGGRRLELNPAGDSCPGDAGSGQTFVSSPRAVTSPVLPPGAQALCENRNETFHHAVRGASLVLTPALISVGFTFF